MIVFGRHDQLVNALQTVDEEGALTHTAKNLGERMEENVIKHLVWKILLSRVSSSGTIYFLVFQ